MLGFDFSKQQNTSESYVDPSQQPYLNWIRNQGLWQASRSMGQQGTLQGISQGLMGQGTQFLNNLQGIGSPEMQAAQIGQLGTQLGDFFSEQINPAIRGNAQQAMQLGGSRQGIAQGLAAGKLGQAFSSGATDIMANAQQQRLQASMGGLSQLPGLMGVAGDPYTAQYNPLMQFAAILGGPTVLNESQGSQQAWGMSGLFG